MKILIVHNEYGIFTGEEAVVHGIINLLNQGGHHVATFIRSSTKIPNLRFGKLKAFCSGIYSFSSRQAIRILLI